jgi:hypothetical protein
MHANSSQRRVHTPICIAVVLAALLGVAALAGAASLASPAQARNREADDTRVATIHRDFIGAISPGMRSPAAAASGSARRPPHRAAASSAARIPEPILARSNSTVMIGAW